MKVCKVKQCGRSVYAKKCCVGHYRRLTRGQTLSGPLASRPVSKKSAKKVSEKPRKLVAEKKVAPKYGEKAGYTMVHARIPGADIASIERAAKAFKITQYALLGKVVHGFAQLCA